MTEVLDTLLSENNDSTFHSSKLPILSPLSNLYSDHQRAPTQSDILKVNIVFNIFILIDVFNFMNMICLLHFFE